MKIEMDALICLVKGICSCTDSFKLVNISKTSYTSLEGHNRLLLIIIQVVSGTSLLEGSLILNRKKA